MEGTQLFSKSKDHVQSHNPSFNDVCAFLLFLIKEIKSVKFTNIVIKLNIQRSNYTNYYLYNTLLTHRLALKSAPTY